MKRFLCFIMALTILATGLLTGCGKETAQVETTEETQMAKNDDGVLNLLMVGSSYCFYYVEELYDLLMENPPEGITQVNVYNLYYSGCKLDWHLNWWIEKKANYEFFRVDATGRKRVEGFDRWTLDQALVIADWDYISLQGTPVGNTYYRDDPKEISVKAAALAGPVLDHFHEMFPNAKLLWHKTWFPEVGRVDTGGHLFTQEEGPVYNAAMAEVCRYMCQEFPKDKPYELTMVPSGLAWTKARQLNESANVLPYGGLCARLGKNAFGDGRANSGDGSHDGDIGGAQLLNAYVWYMILTGKTDLSGVNYVPSYVYENITYTLEPALVELLKEAAVAAVNEP